METEPILTHMMFFILKGVPQAEIIGRSSLFNMAL